MLVLGLCFNSIQQKMRLIFAFILSGVLLGGAGHDPVELNHKKYIKDVRKTFSVSEFHTRELVIPDSIINTWPDLGQFSEIIVSGNEVGYSYTGRVNTQKANGATTGSKEMDALEYFDYFILFDKSLKVLRVTVFNYQALYGQEICAPGWLKQFTGFDGSYKLKVGKNIDAITGATLSSKSIAMDVQRISYVFSRISF